MTLVALVALSLAACGGGGSDVIEEDPGTPQVLSYVGTQTCLSCHTDKAAFLESGHNFKLNKVENGQRPEYAFSSIEGALELLEDVEGPLGTPTSWADVSYTIGGYKKVVMFLDVDGYIMNGPKSGVRLGPDKTPMAAFPHDVGHGPGMFDYCGRCHTTGWKDHTFEEGDDRNLDRQDGLPGMGGTFHQTGIQCESCHGAGSVHAENPSAANITRLADGRDTSDFLEDDMAYGKAVACAECHTKQGERVYPSFLSPFNEEFGGDSLGGLVLADTGGLGGRGGRMAIDTLLGMDPDTLEVTGPHSSFRCTTCHDPHLSKHYQDQPGHEGAMVKSCTDCHTSVEFAGSAMAQAAHANMATCTDCHMPTASHMFTIDLSVESTDPYHYSADGTYSKPWLRASDSCQSCHEADYEDRARALGRIHR